MPDRAQSLMSNANGSASRSGSVGLQPPLRHILDNGMVVLLQPTTHAPVATFWTWYRVGSRNELPGRTGISHWVEHMMFKGTPSFPKGEIDRRIARNGGTFNGLTWIDWTTYFETLPADRIDLALDLEADRMQNSVFDRDEVESERTVIISEREGHENSPFFLLMEEVQSSAIKVHPYHHEVIGWKTDLRSITRDDLYEHYRLYYHPGNAIGVAVGAFDPDDMLARIVDRFGQIPAGPEAPPVTIVEPDQRGERRVTVTGTDETSYVLVAYPAPAADDPTYFAFQVLDTVLGGAKSMNLFGGNPPNRSSRLYRALVESELASSISSGMAATVDPFLYTVSGVVRSGADADAVERAIIDEVARIRDEPLSDEELERAKKQARAQFAYSAESVTNQGFWHGFAEVIASQDWMLNHLSALDAVTAKAVSDAAATWLADHRRTVGRYSAGAAR